MVSEVPDTAYEICTKYAPNCGGSTLIGGHEYVNLSKSKSRGSEGRRKSSGRNKTRTNRKNIQKDIGNNLVSSSRSRNLNLRSPNSETIVSSDDEYGNLGIGLNGEEDYYDSLNSGNEDGVFGEVTNTDNAPIIPVEDISETYFTNEGNVSRDFGNGHSDNGNEVNYVRFFFQK